MLIFRMNRLAAVSVLSGLCTLTCFGQTMNVKVIQRQNNETGYSGYVPGHSSSSSNTSVNCYGGSTNVNCSGATTTNGTITASREISYSVTGATLSLLLPDGRVAVVNCVSKYAPKGDYVNRRSCRMPLVNDIHVEFKGKNAKLIWTASIDGKKFDSETYKILAVLDK
jgi:hypothetical protein